MDEKQARELLKKYRIGKLAEEERALLESWYLAQVSENQSALDEEELRHNLHLIRKRLVSRTAPRYVPPIYRWGASAAAILVIASLAWFFLRNGPTLPPRHNVQQDVMPGGNKATLTLADGRTVQLSTDRNGIAVTEDGITYTDGTAVLATAHIDETANIPDGRGRWLSISTPRGGTYHVTLADGTNIWLNAGSTLRYPARFDGAERIVELEGEAYFEVKKTPTKRIPFTVKSNGQAISVLGTEFNVAAYADEPTVRTVLVEGSVKIVAHTAKREVLLKPGEEAVLSSAGIQTREANVASVTAWKTGKFRFDDTELHEIMNQLSRWYDVEVEYRGVIKKTYFYGVMNRDETLAGVLEALRAGGVNFSIEHSNGKTKLIVLP